ncbi:MAG: hypothetical protein ACRC4W_02280 [Treponemataceae bacterium]
MKTINKEDFSFVKYAKTRDSLINNINLYKTIKSYEVAVVKTVKKFVHKNKMLDGVNQQYLAEFLYDEQERYQTAIKKVFVLRNEYEKQKQIENIYAEHYKEGLFFNVDIKNTTSFWCFDLLLNNIALAIFIKNNNIRLHTKIFAVNQRKKLSLMSINMPYVLR